MVSTVNSGRSGSQKLNDTVVEIHSLREYGNAVSPNVSSPDMKEDNYPMQ